MSLKFKSRFNISWHIGLYMSFKHTLFNFYILFLYKNKLKIIVNTIEGIHRETYNKNNPSCSLEAGGLKGLKGSLFGVSTTMNSR